MMCKFMAFAALCPLALTVVAMEPAMEDAIRHGAMARIGVGTSIFQSNAERYES